MVHIVVPQLAIDSLLLLVRIVIGIAFLHEFRIKARNMRKFAKSHDIPLGAAWFTTIAELAAAGGMLTGILAQLAGFGVMLLMLITTSMVIIKWHTVYWAQEGGWEYDVMLFVLAAVVACFGAGSFVLIN
ncbi:MAG: DoxX family protein [Candidatus Saccharibacteria bacterium]